MSRMGGLTPLQIICLKCAAGLAPDISNKASIVFSFSDSSIKGSVFGEQPALRRNAKRWNHCSCARGISESARCSKDYISSDRRTTVLVVSVDEIVKDNINGRGRS